MTDKLRDAAQQVEREAFEAKWTTPTNCTWTGNGYCSTEYHAWSAESHALRWEGWKARAELAQQDAQAAPPPENETESVHEAVMAVNNAASTPPTHQR